MSQPTDPIAGRRRLLAPAAASIAVALTLLAAAVIVRVAGPAPATTPPAPVAHAAANVPLPSDCAPNPHPPPTQYGFVARVQGGSLRGPNLDVTGMDVSICGVITLVRPQAGSGCTGIQGQLDIPADGIVVNAMSAKLTTIPNHPLDLPVDVHALPTSTKIQCASSSGGLKADLDIDVVGSTGLFGLQCKIPLGGGAHAVLTGKLLNPPYEGDVLLTGSMKAGKVSNKDRWCPGLLPDRIDAIAGLPGSGYQARWPGKVTIYQPNS